MLILLLLGAAVAVARQPGLLGELGSMAFRFQLPHFALTGLRWEDTLTGVFVLGLPQAALTLGNAIITTVEENNTLFPDRRVTVRHVAVDHGLMNLVGASLGGVPMCHGAGGMAGHVRFGARTGGSLVILGLLVLFVGLFLADSAATLFKLFPPSVLGAILFFAGLTGRRPGQERPLRVAHHGGGVHVEHGRRVPRRIAPVACRPAGLVEGVTLAPGRVRGVSALESEAAGGGAGPGRQTPR